MCGIAGVLYADSGRVVSEMLLKDMGNAIAHRGPDGEGTFRAGPIGLVHRRLAIIDLEGGRQPLSNEDKSIHVVFNGEIYNYQELRRQLETRGHVFRTNSDTEVLVHLYEEHGADPLALEVRGDGERLAARSVVERESERLRGERRPVEPLVVAEVRERGGAGARLLLAVGARASCNGHRRGRDGRNHRRETDRAPRNAHRPPIVSDVDPHVNGTPSRRRRVRASVMKRRLRACLTM